MKAHVVENGVVVNTIEVTSLDILPNLIEATEGSIGWTYVDGQFIDTTPQVEPVTPTPPAPTKEQLMAELAALTAKIQALE